MLAAAPDVGYIHEPFNVGFVFAYGPDVTNWYQHIDATNAAACETDARAEPEGPRPDSEEQASA